MPGVLGPVYIGDNVRVGAGSVVLKNLPANTTAVRCSGRSGPRARQQSCPADDLNQQALPDVLSNRISALEALEPHGSRHAGRVPARQTAFAARKRTVCRRRIRIQKE